MPRTQEKFFYEFSEPVVCRCGTPCVVNMVKGQWFLNYSNPEWKAKVYKCLSQMRIIPEEYRVEFENKVDWLKDKACARRKGLGTRLPFDKEWLIESLGDSTIYMSYYIIARFIEKGELALEQLTLSFFDYVLLETGDSAAVLQKPASNRNSWKKFAATSITGTRLTCALQEKTLSRTTCFSSSSTMWPSLKRTGGQEPLQ